MRLFAAGMKPVAIPHECSCDPHQAPAQAQGEQISRKSVHSPIRLGTLCIASHVESKVLGNFLLVAKEGLE